MVDLVDDIKGKLNRYNEWVSQVFVWANSHGITLRQAMSILSEHDNNDKITMHELLSWSECDDFIFEWKEQHND